MRPQFSSLGKMPPILSLVSRDSSLNCWGEASEVADAPPGLCLSSLVLFSPDPFQLPCSHRQQTGAPPAPLPSVPAPSEPLQTRPCPGSLKLTICAPARLSHQRGGTHFKLAALCGRTDRPSSRGGGGGRQACACASQGALVFWAPRMVCDRRTDGEPSASQNWHLTLPLKSATSLQGRRPSKKKRPCKTKTRATPHPQPGLPARHRPALKSTLREHTKLTGQRGSTHQIQRLGSRETRPVGLPC